MGDLKLPLHHAAAGSARPRGPAPTALPKRSPGSSHVPRTLLRIDAASGAAQQLVLDRLAVIRRCGLPARDLRLLDPLFAYPPAFLCRERALVVNLERVRCVVTADEALVLVGGEGGPVGGASETERYAREVQRRLVLHGGQNGDLPFELVALEAALDAACVFLDDQAKQLEFEAYPLLDELASNINIVRLESVRCLKKDLVALTMRVQKVKEKIEQLMDDDDDMADMYLTEKKQRMEATMADEKEPLLGTRGGHSSAPVSPVSSPRALHIERNLSITTRSKHATSVNSSQYPTNNVVELEMLLEAYFVAIDCTLNNLTSLKEYVDDTEVFINLKLDNVRNQLINVELMLTVGTFVVAMLSVVSGVFGMNFQTPIFSYPDAFQWVIVTSGIGAVLVFCAFLWYFKNMRLVPL